MRQPLSDFEEREDGLELMGEDRGDEFSRRDRRLPRVLLTVVAMAVFAGGLWLAYEYGTRRPAVTAQGNGVPLIHASEQPDKVKPDQPGGMKMPDPNVSIYNEKPGSAPVEKLLPPPEKPMPRPIAPADRSTMTTQPADAAAPAPAASPPASAAPPAPEAAGKPAPPVPTPQVKPGPAEGAAAAHSGEASPVQVRLGSLRSPEAARVEWTRLKRTNPDLLGKLTAVAVRTDLGEKGIYYRIEAGPFADEAAAASLCSELKRRGLGCILAR